MPEVTLSSYEVTNIFGGDANQGYCFSIESHPASPREETLYKLLSALEVTHGSIT